ncbi:MAG: leucine--tRNA ligase [Candidatus Amesbacteria bacterium]|nr:leucine--tRNA ligase [Candidatus Amesbacteria bacterium]
MANFDHKEIEAKWSKIWDDTNLYKTPEKIASKGKKYVLGMWPYPSGAGLHVGHVEVFAATDIYSRYLRMNGYSVIHPMGWDSFGLPAENYAIKTGIHPSIQTQKSIVVFKNQMERIGLAYDWERELNASDPEYYKWTQWIFIQLFKKGLAYKAKAPVNWCPSCETVLANEQVVDEKCERCDSVVTQRLMEQWFFKITDYAQRLLDGLNIIDWPASTKAMQRNWIGRKEGHKIKFDDIEVFTTRIDTLHGASFIAIANDSQEGFVGKYVTNPATGKKIPVWRADYVLDTYGTGAVMGVPAHDERDLAFAKKYNLEIIQMQPDPTMEKYGQKKVQYRLRDWLISRQRYWGTPIPMVNCEICGWQPVPEDQLPVKLPTDVDFRPTGESPITRSKTFQKGVICPKCGKSAKREVDTMDTFVDSSWYFLRFCDPTNLNAIFSKDKVKAWTPVDLYIGGDHATTHLIFARFINMFLYDIKLVSVPEPFVKFYKNGHVLGEDNRKMSKRWGNIVNPLEIVDKFGADSLRLYEMFMGPLDMAKVWNTSGVEGVYRFLNRLYRKFETTFNLDGDIGSLNKITNQLIGRVTRDIENMTFNTGIAAMMETFNKMSDATGNWRLAWRQFTLVLAPFAPYLAEEMWQKLGHTDSVHSQRWPEYDPAMVIDEKITMVVQINGKVREKFELDSGEAGEDKIKQLALESAKVQNYLKGASYRTIFVPCKLINFIVNTK